MLNIKGLLTNSEQTACQCMQLLFSAHKQTNMMNAFCSFWESSVCKNEARAWAEDDVVWLPADSGVAARMALSHGLGREMHFRELLQIPQNCESYAENGLFTLLFPGVVFFSKLLIGVSSFSRAFWVQHFLPQNQEKKTRL